MSVYCLQIEYYIHGLHILRIFISVKALCSFKLLLIIGSLLFVYFLEKNWTSNKYNTLYILFKKNTNIHNNHLLRMMGAVGWCHGPR